MRIIKTCYMCDGSKTSDEHAPPKSFFPKNLRKNLITVPSCDIHNSKKSGDDEYLRIMISSHYETNEEGHENIFQKAIGAFKHRPNLIKSFFFRGKIYPASFKGESTMVFHYDHDRFVKAIEYMAKAIYFYHFKSKWNEKLNIINTSAVFSPEQSNYMNKNAEYEKLKEMEFGTPKNGENQSIFYYQLLSDKNPRSSVLKMVFYEGFVVFAIPASASQSLNQI